MIRTQDIDRYLAELHDGGDALVQEMQAHGRRESIPIVDRETGVHLHVLARATGARRIIEIGTAIGFSTLFLARALPPDGQLVTFEVDPERQDAARTYLERAGVADRVDLRLQPALEGLAELEGPFDLAFLDALKHEYGAYLDAVLPLLRSGGLVVVDNVLMRGAVATGRPEAGWTEERVQTARRFNDALLHHPELTATVTPVGDGVALAVRR